MAGRSLGPAEDADANRCLLVDFHRADGPGVGIYEPGSREIRLWGGRSRRLPVDCAGARTLVPFLGSRTSQRHHVDERTIRRSDCSPSGYAAHRAARLAIVIRHVRSAWRDLVSVLLAR